MIGNAFCVTVARRKRQLFLLYLLGKIVPSRATRAVKEMGRGFPLQKYNFCGASSEAKGEWGNVDSGKAVAKTSCHKCADVARMIDRAKVKKAIRTGWLML